MATNHYMFTGFKKNKRNKTSKALFLTTTLSDEIIKKAMAKCKYVYDTCVFVDTFVSNDKELCEWRQRADMVVCLGLFEELDIIRAVG